MVISIIIREGITGVNDHAFNYNNNLKYAAFPSTCTTINGFAYFSEPRFDIPYGIKEIAKEAFHSSYSLAVVTIPDTVTTIREAAFVDCQALNKIYIPASVTKIEKYAIGYKEVGSDEFEPVKGFVIEGVEGSAAEAYASARGFTFRAVDHQHTGGTGDCNGYAICEKCEAKYFTAEYAEHIFGDYSENGDYWHYRKCSACGRTSYDPHKYNEEWQTTKEPTYSEPGVKTRKCIDCGCEQQEEIPALIPELAITTQPSDVTVDAGETVNFQIAAIGDTLKYQWKKSTDGGKTWVNSGSTGATTDTLTMTTKATFNGYKFKCVVTDKNGETAESDVATLTVKAGLAITTQPANATVTAGANVTFKIAATGDTLKYQWKKSTDGGKTWANSASTGATTNTLTMTTKATFNGYKFKCVVTDKNGKVVESNAATLTVTAADAPAITSQPANATVAAGANVTFKIAATGDTLKYQWKKSTDGGKTWANSASTGATTNTLTMATKASFNGLQFKCVVTDKNGKTVTSNAATLKVTAAAALAITAQPSDTIVLAGATAIFKITATGDTLKYQWKKSSDGGKTWANSSSTGATTNTLSMTTKASYDGMQFKCVVTDKNGKTVTSNAATLKIASSAPSGVPAPVITAQPVNVTVASGATATFKIAATGTGLKYQWKKSTDGGKTWVNSSSTGCTTNTLSMATKASFNGIQFKCVVTDAAGKTVTSNAATLTVK